MRCHACPLLLLLRRDRPELSEALCEEMMTRQLELADKVSQHPVLTCLSPWMENLTIAAHWKGTWCERLLKSMYYVTLRWVRGGSAGWSSQKLHDETWLLLAGLGGSAGFPVSPAVVSAACRHGGNLPSGLSPRDCS